MNQLEYNDRIKKSKYLTEKISAVVSNKSDSQYYLILAFALILICFGIYGTVVTAQDGIGSWGLNSRISWGIAIVNFVFWIGIAHAGTLISAILFLFRRKWRTALNRSAEAMTIIAIVCAGIFPLIHTGRPWLAFYWMFPYPSDTGTWVNFMSPLEWDYFAITTYFIVSLIFWYVGLIPDLALLSKYVSSKILRMLYVFFSLGWIGSLKQWRNHQILYLLLAGLATPLVLSVHSIVSFDFAASINPGWHSTIFPPYFVAGAIFSGCAMVLCLLIFARKALGLEEFITKTHFDKLNKVILLGSLLIIYSYSIDLFADWYNGNVNFIDSFNFTQIGATKILMVLGCFVLPQLLWLKKVRVNFILMFIISIFVNVGMWSERYVIVVSSMESENNIGGTIGYSPTFAEVSIFLGSFGIFILLYLIFLRFIPVVAISEMKSHFNNLSDINE